MLSVLITVKHVYTPFKKNCHSDSTKHGIMAMNAHKTEPFAY